MVSYTIYGGAPSFMYCVTCVLFIFTLMNSGSAWMMCGDRVLAMASADGGFFPFFGAFHPRLGTPLRANLLSGVIATIFSFAAVLLKLWRVIDVRGRPEHRDLDDAASYILISRLHTCCAVAVPTPLGRSGWAGTATV